MANQSKLKFDKNIPTNSQLWGNMMREVFFKNNKRKAITGSVLAVILVLLKYRHSANQQSSNLKGSDIRIPSRRGGRGNVDGIFFKRILKLIKIVIPTLKCSAIADIVQLTVFLVVRTYLSIYISNINGLIVRAIIKNDYQLFLKRITGLAIIAIPASFVNSYLDYLNKSLAIYFRSRLTRYINDQYLKNMIFYQITNLDMRVQNPDQRLTADIEQWANSLSVIYSNFSKPLLDIVLFSKNLAALVGWTGPAITVGWYFLSGVVIKLVSPPFGKLTAREQKLQGEYRSSHTDLVHHCEEIAFYKGNDWEKQTIEANFERLMDHSTNIMKQKLYMGTFDSLLVKYGAVMIGYAILGLPVFGPGGKEYLARLGNDKSAVTRDYIRNSSLLINLAKAIGRLVISYKEIQHLAGYTTLVAEMNDVLRDLNTGHYQRILAEGAEEFGLVREPNKPTTISLKNENIIEMEDVDFIEFDNMPIITPNGEKLVKPMHFRIEQGQNVVITGPNGCGKSSLFRILGGLWPIIAGSAKRPKVEKIFYIPQRPYLPNGSLREQIIYPHEKINMDRKKMNDNDLRDLMKIVSLDYLIEREGGFNTVKEWTDVLSGGEKQRIAMARMFYHKPCFAILDECTSAVSSDVESSLYTNAKKMGITLFTVSHRPTIYQYHDYLLSFNGQGEWSFEKFIKDDAQKVAQN